MIKVILDSDNRDENQSAKKKNLKKQNKKKKQEQKFVVWGSYSFLLIKNKQTNKQKKTIVVHSIASYLPTT